MNQLLTILFECYDFPASAENLLLGIQEGKVVVQDKPVVPGEILQFEAELLVEQGIPGERTRFRGKFLQGTRQEPFLYLCWGERANDGAWIMIRRAKFPLSALPTREIDAALKNKTPIRVRVNMTDKRGDPVCAMLRDGQYEVG